MQQPRPWPDMACDLASRALITAGASLGALLFCAAAVVWLKTAQWPSFTAAEALVALGLPHPQFSWAGVQQIADLLPAWLAIPALANAGVLLLAVGRSLALSAARRLRRIAYNAPRALGEQPIEGLTSAS